MFRILQTDVEHFEINKCTLLITNGNLPCTAFVYKSIRDLHQFVSMNNNDINEKKEQSESTIPL